MHDRLTVVEVKDPIDLDWCTIYNTYTFYNLHKTTNSFYFVLKDVTTNSIIGVCHFTETEPGVYKSPAKGTFSGIELREPDIEVLFFFIEELETILKHKGVLNIVLAPPPFHHNSQYSSYLFNTLFNRNYYISDQELNYAMAIDETPMVEKMNRNNKKRLNKCIREGFVFEQLNNEEDFLKAYTIIATNRIGRGHPLTMTFDQIMEMYKLFNDNLFFFIGRLNGIDVVSSICIKLNKDILYVFYWGDLLGYEQYSPVVFIANGIYEFGQKSNFKMLDAGISTAHGKPNLGLMKFKENLGMNMSLRLRYTKNL